MIIDNDVFVYNQFKIYWIKALKTELDTWI